ncbi:hypothetical protein D9619_005435 [Psilocybe cf. subviscida]|uniref:Proteasome assembly chaperone 3 n=1 Tax=Psilocybe cf. subviscida TaxID=2480587 RepID=A0A8H5BYW5_9AGAR|nr:hypothetical protein D9619_005435 [Psilocybe cf. subviscida]
MNLLSQYYLFKVASMVSLTPRLTSHEIAGKHTQVFIQTFADRVMVLVTQLGKVGNLIQATLPATAALLPPSIEPLQSNKLNLPEPPAAVELTPLLGSAPSAHMQTLHSLYASQIATIIWTEGSQHGLESSRKSVVVGLALAKTPDSEAGSTGQVERDLFEGVMRMVYDLLRSG